MIKVGILDDHLLIINGIKEMLGRIPSAKITAAYTTIEESRKRLPIDQPDVFLLDINLPDGDGVKYCQELRKDFQAMKILALTSFNQLLLVKNILRNGANGFLLKNTSLEELKTAIETVYAGDVFLQSEIKEMLLKESIGLEVRNKFMEPRLTRREKEILQLIAEEYTSQKIAEKLFISLKTVETHRSHLMEKLQVNNAAGMVKVALEKGLIN